MSNLTQTAAEVLAYIKKHLAEEDNMPTLQTLTDHFGWAFFSNADYYIKKLIAAGELEKRGRNYRLARKKTC